MPASSARLREVMQMNVRAQTTTQTAAETALLEAFGQRVSELPGDATITVKRDDAIESLKGGLPTRKVEAWHYTDLRRLLSDVPPFNPTAHAEPIAPLLEGASILPVLNGVAGKAPEIEGATVGTIAERLADGGLGDLLDAHGPDDTVSAINAAFVADGFSLDIAEDAEIAAPIELQNIHGGGQTHSRFTVKAGARSKATIIERQTGEGAALVSSIGHLDVGDEAEIAWLIIQEQPEDVTHLGQINITIGANSKLTLFIMNAGGRLVRQEIRATAKGEGSKFRLRGVNLLSGRTHCDVTMILDHNAPDTFSTETLRNVVTDKAHGVFAGQIRVAKHAQKTDAKMACNTLLLSDEGEFSAKPELEIFADDVACGHGATVTEIDHDHLFYLMARGIDEKTARGLLVRAFVAEVIEELDDEASVEALETKLGDWFATHG